MILEFLALRGGSCPAIMKNKGEKTMKAEKVFNAAVGFLFEQPGYDVDFKTHAPSIINSLVAESLMYENSVRAARGESELEQAPHIESLEDDIPYCDEICRIALPFGLVSYFYQDEGDGYKAQDFRARFIDALRESAKAVITDCEDVYGNMEG